VFHAARDSDGHHHGFSVITILMVMNIQIKSILIVEILEIPCPSRSYHHKVLLLIETSSPIGFLRWKLSRLSDIPNQCLISDFCDMRRHHRDDHVEHHHLGDDHNYIRRAISPLLVMGLYSDDREALSFTYNLFPILKQNDGHNDQEDPRQLYSFFL